MAREDRKRRQPDGDEAADEGERRGRRDKRPKEEKPAPPLPSEIRNKEKRSEVYAKLKREKKAQKRRLGRERGQAAQRAAELGEEASVFSSPTPETFFFQWDARLWMDSDSLLARLGVCRCRRSRSPGRSRTPGSLTRPSAVLTTRRFVQCLLCC